MVHEFQILGTCVNIAKVEYRGHGIHRNTLVGFCFMFSGMRDKKN
jgi:hypothetical protein